MKPAIVSAIKFFAANAGYSTPPGRMACAKALAIAEDKAQELGLTVEWSQDFDPDTSWLEQKGFEKDKRDYESGSLEILQALGRDENGKAYASLGGIALYPFGQAGENYQRVVAAELFAETIAELTDSYSI